MKKTILIATLILIYLGSGYGQSVDSIYNLTAYGNLGFVRNITSFDFEYPSLDRNGFIGNLKIMWKPDYLLRAGIEVSRSDVYSVNESAVPTDSGTTSLQTDVYAWTYMAVFSMSPVTNLEINLATGLGFTTVNNSAFGVESSSTDFGSVFMLSAGYFFPVSKDFNIGAELRGMKIAKYDDYTIALQLSLAYKFLEW
ncbi:MAG: hypothetical protein U5J96_08090 [Ignavibacteriaceae bacterium]|nr:hypothetical protein [Ignavibacteriaceae bacterium]